MRLGIICADVAPFGGISSILTDRQQERLYRIIKEGPFITWDTYLPHRWRAAPDPDENAIVTTHPNASVVLADFLSVGHNYDIDLRIPGYYHDADANINVLRLDRAEFYIILPHPSLDLRNIEVIQGKNCGIINP